jgi:hypothetical protein
MDQEYQHPLYTLQLSEGRRRRLIRLPCIECVIGGALGALAVIALVWWAGQ